MRPLPTGSRQLTARKQLLLKTAEMSDSEEIKREHGCSSEGGGASVGQVGEDESSEEEEAKEFKGYFKGPGITEKFEDAVYNYYGSKSLGIEATNPAEQEEMALASSIVLPMTSGQTVIDL